MSTIQKFTFCGQIWAKMTKNAIFGYKNGQKYHFWVGFMKQKLCQMLSINPSEFSEKTFFEVGQLHYPLLIAPQSVYIKYIYCVFFEVAKTSK